jgi:hypothetical protein
LPKWVKQARPRRRIIRSTRWQQENIMATQSKLENVCEVVGVFHKAEDLESAIDELLISGFDRAEISLLASEDAVATKLGGYYRPASELADDPAVPRAAFVSTAAIGDAEGALIGGLAYVGAIVATGAVVMSGGALAAAVTAAALAGGAGGLVGSVLARLVGHHHAAYLQDQIENGGLLLWVRAWNESDEARALEIITKHAADKVHSRGICATTA